jgi:hypothetical protein
VETKYKVLIRSRVNQTPEMIKKLLKSKVSPTKIKVGITSLKLLRHESHDRSKQQNEIEALGNKIKETCEAELEVNIQKRRNPRIVPLSIPEDIILENVEEILAKQTPELDLKEGDIRANFCYTIKRETRNSVIEVEPERK